MFPKRLDGCRSLRWPKFSHPEWRFIQRICVPGVVHGLCLTTATIFRRFVWEIIPDLFRSDHAPMKITVTGTATTWRLRRIILNCRAFAYNFVWEKKSSSQYWFVRCKAYCSHKQFRSWHYTNFHPEATKCTLVEWRLF